MKCSFCYYQTLFYEKELNQCLDFYDISTELLELKLSVFDIIDKVYLSGGEPLLHSKFRDIVAIVEKKAKKIYVCTNATLIDESYCDFFLEHGVVLVISIKDDSIETYNKLEWMHDKGVKIELYHVLNKKSIKLLQTFNERYSWVSKFRLLFETSSDIKRKLISPIEWFTLLKISFFYLKPILDIVEVEIAYLPKNHKIALSTDKGAVNERIIIDYDGKAYSCPLLVEKGNGSTDINNVNRCNIIQCPVIKKDLESGTFVQVCPFLLTKLQNVFIFKQNAD